MPNLEHVEKKQTHNDDINDPHPLSWQVRQKALECEQRHERCLQMEKRCEEMSKLAEEQMQTYQMKCFLMEKAPDFWFIKMPMNVYDKL